MKYNSPSTKGCKMNDRFKFRVWNNKHNRYIVDSHYPIGSDHIIVIRQDGKAYNLGLGDYEDYSNMHSWAVMEEFTDCILEQCTGLKDKNGNLIYEGDIVEITIFGSVGPNGGYVDSDEIHKGTVVWDRDCFLAKTDAYTILFPHSEDCIEIVGNIHEQAEQKKQNN